MSRTLRNKSLRQELGLVLEPESSLSLQQQIRRKLVDAIDRGLLRPGRRLPSSRRLSRQIGVSRNTVTLAYDALLAAGRLISRSRSGIFVSPSVQAERVTTGRRGLRAALPRAMPHDAPLAEPGQFRRPPNWHHHPYPFLDGCLDPTLVPVDEWREALRLAFGKRELLQWAGSNAELDDAPLSEALRSSVLPLWGIEAAADELLCAASPAQALAISLEALLARHGIVAVDESVDTETRQRLAVLRAQILSIGDPFGHSPDVLPQGGLLLLGARRLPAATTPTREQAERLLLAAARADALIVECATAPDSPVPRRGVPSLRALDTEGRVVLLGAPSATVSIGTPPGIINAAAPLIERMREVRRLHGGAPATGLQRAWAYFIGLGHYATVTSRIAATLQKRRTALRDALNHYLHKFVSIHATGAGAYWVDAGAHVDANTLALNAARVGVLIEPAGEARRPGLFSMGVTSLPANRIRAGVERLASVVRHDPELAGREIRVERDAILRGSALRRAMAGTTLLYNTVYGEPCTIHLRSDGTLIGRAGYANEDRDTGRWWVDGDRWYRQWQSWAYGETTAFVTSISGDQVRWFKEDGLLADTAIIVRAARRRSAAPSGLT
jgi:GntR family transcriptional regulator/MocR family aminotransferase